MLKSHVFLESKNHRVRCAPPVRHGRAASTQAHEGRNQWFQQRPRITDMGRLRAEGAWNRWFHQRPRSNDQGAASHWEIFPWSPWACYLSPKRLGCGIGARPRLETRLEGSLGRAQRDVAPSEIGRGERTSSLACTGPRRGKVDLICIEAWPGNQGLTESLGPGGGCRHQTIDHRPSTIDHGRLLLLKIEHGVARGSAVLLANRREDLHFASIE